MEEVLNAIGYVYRVENDLEELIFVYKEKEHRITVMRPNMPFELQQKGRHFELSITENTLMFIPRPDLDDNQWSREAAKIDLSYLDEDV